MQQHNFSKHIMPLKTSDLLCVYFYSLNLLCCSQFLLWPPKRPRNLKTLALPRGRRRAWAHTVLRTALLPCCGVALGFVPLLHSSAPPQVSSHTSEAQHSRAWHRMRPAQRPSHSPQGSLWLAKAAGPSTASGLSAASVREQHDVTNWRLFWRGRSTPR